MARKFPPLGEELVKQIEQAWEEPQPEWARQRLRVVRLIAQHELTAAEIMRVADVSRQTIFTYRDKVVAEGVTGLLQREWKGARKVLRRLGGKLKVPRKSHVKKDQAKADAFKAELPARLTAVVGAAPDRPVRLWVLDEHRYGRVPVIRRVWARRGVRVCLDRGHG